jgi:putative ABC transport system substrate-binding protein
VRSLAKPGGNITGVFLDLPELSGKQLQLLKEIIGSLSRVAILGDPVLNAPQFQATEAAARSLAMQAQLLDVRGSKDIDTALGAASRDKRRDPPPSFAVVPIIDRRWCPRDQEPLPPFRCS